MNENVKSLAIIYANRRREEDGLGIVYVFTEQALQLFADKIIDKSAEVITNGGYMSGGPLGPKRQCTPPEIAQMIKEHFAAPYVRPKPKCSVCGTTENVRYMGGYQEYLCDSAECIPF